VGVVTVVGFSVSGMLLVGIVVGDVVGASETGDMVGVADGVSLGTSLGMSLGTSLGTVEGFGMDMLKLRLNGMEPSDPYISSSKLCIQDKGKYSDYVSD